MCDHAPCDDRHRLPLIQTLVILAFVVACPLASQVLAADYTLKWDSNTDPGLKGYKVYWGTQSRNYTKSRDVGNVTSHTLTGLDNATTYFFAATAYDQSGRESDYSEEVSSTPRNLLFGIGPNPGNGGWIEVLGPNHEHKHWLQVSWPEYNALGGEARVATGDIDGDGKDEIIVGLGPNSQSPGFAQGFFEVLDDDFSHLAWGQVNWPDYNAMNGETWPATGDLDGNGRDEILVGLGPGGKGSFAVFSYQNGAVVQTGWSAIWWPDYTNLQGETRVAAGDMDGDGLAEIVVGLGPLAGYPGIPDGVFTIFNHDLTYRDWWKILWPEYCTNNGEVFPAVGDLDGDGKAEIIMGLGAWSSGNVAVYTLKDGELEWSRWFNYEWPEYSSLLGETHPTVGDLDMDSQRELLLGFGRGSGGRNMLYDDALTSFAHLMTLDIWPEEYVQESGASWPAIQNLR